MVGWRGVGLTVAALLAPGPGLGAQPAVELVPVMSGLVQPVTVTHAGDGRGRLFVAERAGSILVGRPGQGPPTVFLNLSDRVMPGGERGLLGLAFHPGFAQNRRLFVHYSGQPDGHTVVAEFRASATDPEVAEPGESVLLTVPQPFGNHNGGTIAFGPDGLLYIALGDGGSGYDPGNRAQDPGSLLGKILRLDVDHPTGGLPYGIPPDNPFAGTGTGRPEIFALGFRNPYRFAFDSLTGALVAGDVGQDEREEIDLVTRGGNYGWRVLEGTDCTGTDPALCTDPVFQPPVLEYRNAGRRCAVIGGVVYRGAAGTLPGGTYLFADLCSGELFASDAGVHRLLLETGRAIVGFGTDEAGEVHVVDLGGTVLKVVRRAGTGPRATVGINRLLIRPGQSVDVAAGLAHDGPLPVPTDVYLGAVLPGGVDVVFVTSLAPLTIVRIPLDRPEAYAPLARALGLDPGLDLLVPAAVRFPFTGSELPAGPLTLFVALTPPGNPGQILSLDQLLVEVEP